MGECKAFVPVREGECAEWLMLLVFLQISEHALNSVFALFEIIIPRTDPPPPLHLVFLIILLACYLSVAYITHTVQVRIFWSYSSS